MFRKVALEGCHRRDSHGPPFPENGATLSLFPLSASPSELIHTVNQPYLSSKAHTRAYRTGYFNTLARFLTTGACCTR